MQEKNHKNSSSNGGAFLSFCFLTLSSEFIGYLQAAVVWGARNEVPGVIDPRLLSEDYCRNAAPRWSMIFQKIATKMRQKPQKGNAVTVCFDPALAVYLLEGDLQGIFIFPRTLASINPDSSNYFMTNLPLFRMIFLALQENSLKIWKIAGISELFYTFALGFRFICKLPKRELLAIYFVGPEAFLSSFDDD